MANAVAPSATAMHVTYMNHLRPKELQHRLIQRGLIPEGGRLSMRTQLTLWEFSLSQNHELRTEIFAWLCADDDLLEKEYSRACGNKRKNMHGANELVREIILVGSCSSLDARSR